MYSRIKRLRQVADVTESDLFELFLEIAVFHKEPVIEPDTWKNVWASQVYDCIRKPIHHRRRAFASDSAQNLHRYEITFVHQDYVRRTVMYTFGHLFLQICD